MNSLRNNVKNNLICTCFFVIIIEGTYTCAPPLSKCKQHNAPILWGLIRRLSKKKLKENIFGRRDQDFLFPDCKKISAWNLNLIENCKKKKEKHNHEYNLPHTISRCSFSMSLLTQQGAILHEVHGHITINLYKLMKVSEVYTPLHLCVFIARSLKIVRVHFIIRWIRKIDQNISNMPYSWNTCFLGWYTLQILTTESNYLNF